MLEFTIETSRPFPQLVFFTLLYTTDTAEVTGPNFDPGAGRPQVVRLPANDTSVTFTVPVAEDLIVESDETFTMTLDDDLPPPGTLFGNAAAIATITDNDEATVSIGPVETSQAEGSPFNFNVRLSAPVAEAITVAWTAEESGDSPATLTSPGSDLGPNQDITGTAFFAAGSTTAAPITITTNDDEIVEDAETFIVSLSGTLPAGVVYGNRTATGTITDTDSAVVSIAPAEIVEGGKPAFPVSLSAPVCRDVTLIASTSNGTATAGGDYTSVTNGAVTFPANSDADVMFEVQTLGDRTLDAVRETLTVTLNGTGLPGRVTLSPTASAATGTIVDNESNLISIGDMQAAEGQSVVFPISFTVPLEHLTIVPMTVAATDGSAAPAADLQADLGTWPLGVAFVDPGFATGTTYTVPTDGDSVVEGNETFRVTLGTPGVEDEGPRPRVDRGTAFGTIIDNDTASVSLSPTATAAEGDGTITFTVMLDNPVTEAFTLAWGATDGTATEGNDFEEQIGTVEIPALSQTETFTIDIIDDEEYEEEETFTVALSGTATGLEHIDPGRITVSRSSATGTTTDDDETIVNIADSSSTPRAASPPSANCSFSGTATASSSSASSPPAGREKRNSGCSRPTRNTRPIPAAPGTSTSSARWCGSSPACRPHRPDRSSGLRR